MASTASSGEGPTEPATGDQMKKGVSIFALWESASKAKKTGKMGGWHRLYYQIRPSPWEIEIVGGSISTAQCLALSMTCRHKQCWNLSFITPGPPKLMVLHLL